MRNGGRQNERQVMIRIIKLLFSFADMAERAAYRSILVRTFLLTLFRIAEPVARRYVLRYDGNALKIPEPIRGDGVSGRTETLHLAWLFRVFAIMLTNLMAWRDMGRIDAATSGAQTMRSCNAFRPFSAGIRHSSARAPPQSQRGQFQPPSERHFLVDFRQRISGVAGLARKSTGRSRHNTRPGKAACWTRPQPLQTGPVQTRKTPEPWQSRSWPVQGFWL